MKTRIFIKIFKLKVPKLQKMLNNLKSDNWINLYIHWELDLIKEIGFDLDLRKKFFNNINNDELINIDIDGENYNLPSFIFNRSSIPINDKHIYYALNFISNYIHKKILVPNNLFYPKYRNHLQNLYK